MKKFTEDTQAVVNRSKELINEYGRLAKTASADQLLDMQDRLVVSFAYLGEVEADYNRDYAMSYRNRLQVKSSSIVMAITDGESATRAKEGVEDDPEVQKARFDEITNSYLAESVQNLLKAIDRALKAIQFRLTHIRDERKQSQLSTN